MTRQGNHPKGSKNIAVTRLPTPQEIRQLRKDLGESASTFAKRFDYSRSTIKHYEGGSDPPTQKFASQFWKLRDYMPRISSRIVAAFDLPPFLYLDAKPIQCRGHENWHVFANKKQVYCKAGGKGECRRLWQRRMRAEDPNQPSTRTHRPQGTNAKKRRGKNELRHHARRRNRVRSARPVRASNSSHAGANPKVDKRLNRKPKGASQ